MSEKKMMSKAEIMKAICPFCDGEFDCPVYPEIHIPGDGKLKKRILNRDLFFPVCPYCKTEIKVKPTCMYYDEHKRLLVLVVESPDTVLESIIKNGYRNPDEDIDDNLFIFLKGLVKRRIVYDVDAFREKILLSDYNYDDRIIELMKCSLSELIEKECNDHVHRIFLDESAGNTMKFTAILGIHAPYEYIDISVPSYVYTQYRNKYLDKIGNPEEDEYIYTDQKWAAKSGLLKDENPGFILPV
ncbi:MAG: CpXC domain-containing protein [Lachnospiraceae bacterium]|nr:CpXC domain-containing protein [Lachnospiraceae bacterium]